MFAARLEDDSRAGDDVSHGARDKDLARRGLPGDAGTDVDGDPPDLAIDDLALSGVQARTDLKPKIAHGVE